MPVVITAHEKLSVEKKINVTIIIIIMSLLHVSNCHTVLK